VKGETIITLNPSPSTLYLPPHTVLV